MATYYIKQKGRVSGPVDGEELARRIELNVVRSLDKISEDGATWEFVKDSRFWHQDTEIGGQVDMPFLSSFDSFSSPHPVPIPTRLKRL